MVAKRYAPATSRQKVTTVALLAAMLAGWAIYFSGWKPFQGYEWQVALVAQLAASLYVARLLALLERS